jgi:redox-sensitive bicupin YhaK (pirin superfamily)
MITVMRSEQRGTAEFGWLYSKHSFSFGHYYNPLRMGFGHLRVINEDTVQAGKGFDTHGHKDMEIISYVIQGALEHKDSMGNGSTIRPGDVQRMSAGTGVRHSEYNPSETDPVHFLQIWIIPDQKDLPPGYQQIHFSQEQKANRLCLVASRDGRDGSLSMHQDADLYACLLDPGLTVSFSQGRGRRCWVQLVRGSLSVNGQELAAGDAAAMENEEELEISAIQEAEFLVFDLA